MPQTAAPKQVDAIDNCLPQTQCTLCDYPRCREYAEAIARGEAGINQCPPGGDVTISALPELLDQPVVELDTSHGFHEPKLLASIVESQCIGCKLCIKACPVDCILGAAKAMHTVIAAECTGCKLCVPVCPTDCIVMVDPAPEDVAGQQPSPWPGFSEEQVALARRNTEARLERIEKREMQKQDQRRIKKRERLQQEILQAVQRKTGRYKSGP